MNLTFGQLDPDPVFRQDGWSNRELAPNRSLSINQGSEEPYVMFHGFGGPYSLSKNEAIEAAKAILIEFGVPFCNRVK